MSVFVADAEKAQQRERQLAGAPRAVVAHELSKRFHIPNQQHNTLKERILHPRRRGYTVLDALHNVTFDVAQGEFFGIVGRNGSGKSTLLKCLAGIYDTDIGSITINGRLSPFIELGVGFNPELTARDNVLINATLLGLTRQQARERFDEIVAFGELWDFLDLKLKNYSSGMAVRLAFSIAIQVDADVVLVDEVLAVGDASFQQKCYEQFHKMKDEGKTILFVTHDMGAVERFCDRAMLIEKGDIVDIGDPTHIALEYNRINFGQLLHADPGIAAGEDDVRAAEITAAWFEDAAGERIKSIQQGERIRMCFRVYFNRALENPAFGVTLRNEAHATIFATSSSYSRPETGSFEADSEVTVTVEFDGYIAQSRYALTPSIAELTSETNTIDLKEDVVTLAVHGAHYSGGVLELPHEFTIERGAR